VAVACAGAAVGGVTVALRHPASPANDMRTSKMMVILEDIVLIIPASLARQADKIVKTKKLPRSGGNFFVLF
jgi:hypothetical protein